MMHTIEILSCLLCVAIGRRLLLRDSQKTSLALRALTKYANKNWKCTRKVSRSGELRAGWFVYCLLHEGQLESLQALATFFLGVKLPAAFNPPVAAGGSAVKPPTTRKGAVAACARTTLGPILNPLATAFGVDFSESVSVSGAVSGVRGLVATADIKSGSLLASVRLSSCVTVPFSEDGGEAKLASALLAAIQTSDCWKSYAESVLPSTTHAAFLWSDEELSMLQFQEAQHCAADLRERSVGDHQHGSGISQEEWALSIVYSRSAFLKGTDEETHAELKPMRALVPFLDLINHMPLSGLEFAEMFDVADVQAYESSPQAWEVIRGSEGEARVALRALRDFKSGEEVLIPYGVDYSNAYLLAQYGFVLPANSADYHSLFSDKETMIKCFMKAFGLDQAQACQRLQIMDELYQCDAPPAICSGNLDASFHLLGCVRVAAASDEELEEFEEDYIPPGTPSSELTVLRFCAEQAEARLAECPTTLQEDEQQLLKILEKVQQDVTQKEQRLRLALEYRISVKQLLRDFVSRCKEALEAAAWLNSMST